LGQTLEITKQSSEQDWHVTLGEGSEKPQIEARVFDFEEHRRRRVGREAIKISEDELSYNDALTYLYRRLDDSGVDYLPDFESEIAERLTKKNHFENHVFFESVGDDFVSLNDEVSLTKMTKKNLPRLKRLVPGNPKMEDEYERAKLESREISVISKWFKKAGDGDFLVFESLPLTDGEDFAVTRAYQRVGNILEGCYFSLGNPNLDQFNNLRKEVGAENKDCHTVLEILGAPYEIKNPKFQDN
jgi:hypothetical protein